MSPTMHMTAPPAHYQPTSDMMDRHEYGVLKNRKTASTGGGRAWSEDEEVYLLQTRLQKMPYKHIAAHLKKTELACRLHYHQLSHGSNRRKRTTSVSSGSSTGGHSPVLPATMPSPIHEACSRPAALEQAWRNGPSSSPSPSCCNGPHRQQAQTPITPVLSPEDREAYSISAAKSDKTRISAILGIDADPRSPKEREMVRRMEQRVGA
ncbi:hypothetical protein MAPG_09776 [Magnaporthiopsis poae ATCC 64411]|uniref:Myb-like domain-containing protein n=1 Tax=Magnaporthiopsis poae (strain ATCC 64411 / 73-15) TaxID=644358 RepID=A0A0C4EAU5_MAGP6|nr:hypothetical protein MAPG_09776 [Magnaporthiopsis poae ATCC 64411]